MAKIIALSADQQSQAADFAKSVADARALFQTAVKAQYDFLAGVAGVKSGVRLDLSVSDDGKSLIVR